MGLKLRVRARLDSGEKKLGFEKGGSVECEGEKQQRSEELKKELGEVF